MIARQFDSAGVYAPNGLAAFRRGGLSGYIDRKGLIAIRLQSSRAESFSSNGLAAINISGKYGFIDASGRYNISPRFDLAWAFGVDAPSKNLAKVSEGDRIGYIDSSGNYMIRLAPGVVPWGEFWKRPGKFEDKANAKWGYLGKTGEIVIPAQFATEGSFSENGLAPVMVEKLWGYIDTAGKSVIPFTFTDAGIFSSGLAPAEKDGKWGYIDRTGYFIISPRYDSAESFTPTGLALIEVGPAFQP